MTVIKPRSRATVAFKIHVWFFNFYWSVVALQYFSTLRWFLLYSKVRQLYVYAYPLSWIFFPFRSPQNTEQSSLSYAGDSHLLSI